MTLAAAEQGAPAAAAAPDDAETPEIQPSPEPGEQPVGSARPAGIQNDDSLHGRDRGTVSLGARTLGEYRRGKADAVAGRELTDHPSARVVLNVGSCTLEGVRVWNAKTERYAVAKLEGAIDEKVRQAVRENVARELAHSAVGAIWPAPQRATSADYDIAFAISTILLEPETFLLKAINGVTRAAAMHAGFGGPAGLAGRAAGRIPRPAPHRRGDQGSATR